MRLATVEGASRCGLVCADIFQTTTPQIATAPSVCLTCCGVETCSTGLERSAMLAMVMHHLNVGAQK